MDRCAAILRVRWALPLLLALAVGAESGCSRGRPRLHPVQGQVLYKDQPVDRAMVVLHPLGEYPEGLPQPIAYTDVEGRFSMTTNEPGDGAPAGEYAVTVVQREKTRTGVEKVNARNLLPARYGEPGSSDLRCQVQKGKNELPLSLVDP